MDIMERLPNFLIVGAAKAGTTSLFNILAAHPAVFGSPVKEPCFFSDDARFEKGPEWYQQAYFEGAAGYPIRMEASPVYLTWSEKVVSRLETMYAGRELKFVAIFRDPVERAYSHYWHRVRMGQEPLSFSEAVREEENRLRRNWDELSRTGNGKYGYVRAGCYASRLQPFLEQFPRQKFSFLLLEDLLAERFQPAVASLLDFLEIDAGVDLQSMKFNTATKPRNPWFTRAYWSLKRTFLKPLYRRGIPRQIRKRLHDVMFPPAEYPPMDGEVERLLRLHYRDEVKRLEDILHRDLSHWLPV